MLTIGANLVLLLVVTLLGALAHYLDPGGLFPEVILYVFGISFLVQLIVLFLAAIERIGPVPAITKQTFALWSAATYPFIFLEMDSGVGLAILTAPLGYILAFAWITIVLFVAKRFKRWGIWWPWRKNRPSNEEPPRRAR